MKPTYILALSMGFPGVKAHALGNGSDYASLVWDSGDPLPTQAILDDYISANNLVLDNHTTEFNGVPTITDNNTGTTLPLSNFMIGFGSTINNADNVFLNTYTGNASNVLGCIMARNAALYSIVVAASSPNGSGVSADVVFAIRVNGAAADATTFTLPAGQLTHIELNPNLNFNAGDTVAVRVTSTSKFARPAAQLEFSWR